MTTPSLSMRAGDLRHRVTLQMPGGTRDAMGERITTWTDVATVHAHVEPLTGRDAFYAAQTQASTTHRVTIRWSPAVANITAAWRVLYGTRKLILDAPPKNLEERNRIIELSCVEGLTDE